MRSRVITLHGTVWYSIFGIIERKYFYYIMIRSCPGHINSNIDQLLLVICSKSNSKIRKNCRNGIFRKIEKKCPEKILLRKNFNVKISIRFFNFSKRNYCFYMLFLRHVMHIWSRLFGEFGNHIRDITLIIFQIGLISFTVWIHLQLLLCQGTFTKISPH